NLAIILEKDTLERAKLFEDFIHIEREFTYSMEGANEDMKARHQAAVATVRSNYHPKKPHNSWCWKIVPSKHKEKGVAKNPTFRDLCEHVGQLKDYQRIYGRSSAVIHTEPSYESWLRKGEGGPMELGPQFSPRIEHVGNLSITLAISSFV